MARNRGSEKTIQPSKILGTLRPATSKVVKVRNDNGIQELSLSRKIRRKFLRVGG